MPQQQQRGKPAPPPPPQLGFNVRPPPASEDEPVNLSELGPIKTTKQIHKEYLARTRISKEEAKRQAQELREEERLEREQRKKEAEKAKASNRARFLRDKKKAKEQAARDELRRQGLPTVQVHPSQATISGWFVQGKGAGTKRRVDEVEDAEGGEQPPKRTHVDEPERLSETTGATTVPLPFAPSEGLRQQAQPERPSEMAEATTAPSDPQQSLPIRASTTVAALEPPRGTPSFLAEVEDLFPSSTQVARELAEEWAPVKPPPPPAAVRVAPAPKSGGGNAQPIQKPIPMGPPPRPAPKPASKPAPKPAPKRVLTVNQLGKPKPASTVNQLARQLGSMAAAPVAAATKLVNRIKNSVPFLTQDLVLSTQDVREIEATAPIKPKAQGIVNRIKNSVLSFCSQDLAMSTQDIREVEGPTNKPRAKGAVAPIVAAAQHKKPQYKQPPLSKPRPTRPRNGRSAPPQQVRAGTSKDQSEYDDDIFDDTEALELLEKIESSAKTPALGETAPKMPAPEKAASRGVPAEELVGSGSWLSDDGELDL